MGYGILMRVRWTGLAEEGKEYGGSSGVQGLRGRVFAFATVGWRILVVGNQAGIHGYGMGMGFSWGIEEEDGMGRSDVFLCVCTWTR
jgi:hypothetical protein